MTEKRFSKCKEMWKVFDWETSETLNFKEIINLLNELNDENMQLKQRIKELEIENTAQSDAIDGLQATLVHFDLEEVIK